MNRRRRLVAALTAATALASSCSLGTQDDAARSDADDRAVDTVAVDAADWSPCADRTAAQCATVVVPVDYGDPEGDTLSLALIRPPGPDSRQPGSASPLVVSLGQVPSVGVRSDEVNPVPVLAGLLFPVVDRELREGFEVIGLDPRGTGLSAPLRCPSDPLLAGDLDATPDSKRERAALTRATTAYGRECAAAAGGLAEHLGTAELAADLDAVREALEVDRVSYLGMLGGARIGLSYAEAYPDRVGRVALDSLGPDPSQGPEVWLARRARNMESALDRALTFCLSGLRCPLGSTAAEARAQVSAYLDELEQKPVRTPGVAAPLTRERAVWALDRLLGWGVDGYGTTVRVLTSALNDQGVFLNAVAVNPSIGDGARRARLCVDAARGREAAAPADGAGIGTARVPAWGDSPVFGETFRWAARFMCRGWPDPAPAPATGQGATAAQTSAVLLTDIPQDPTTSEPPPEPPVGGLTTTTLRYDGADASGYIWSSCVRDTVAAFLNGTTLTSLRCPDRTVAPVISTGAELGRSG